MTSERPQLRRLADRMGIVSSHVDGLGVEHETSDETRERLLSAMGIEAPDEASAAAALAGLDRERQGLPPLRVARIDDAARFRLPLHLPRSAGGSFRWEVHVEAEGGGSGVAGGNGSLPDDGSVTISLPPLPLGPGYHRVSLSVRTPEGELSGEQTLAISPASCPAAAERLGGPGFGLLANLYSLRRRRDAGVGDLGALRMLVRWAGEIGAAFVGISPLHATRNREPEVSPYLPISRLFRNPIYLEVDGLTAPAPATPRRHPARVLYEEVWRRKRLALGAQHRAFAARRRVEPVVDYDRFCALGGAALEDFARFQTLEEHHGPGWSAWPAGHRHPRSPDVATFARAHAEEVDFHRWMQFELDRQLAAASRSAPLPLGVFQDLALGSAGDGFDAWAFPELFAHGASVGAPPDGYSASGQNWAFPPISPERLRQDGYGYWLRLLRTAMQHAGMLRIDHIMGLLRQFWIPAGGTGADGAYVRYPADDLLGLLALESRRHGCVVVGEDLGTVPAGFGDMLARWGILSTRVLYFERELDGSFRPPSSYPERALVTANTHDLPPLASFWSGRDLELRRAAGQIPDDEALRAARSGRDGDRLRLEERLSSEGLLPAGGEASPADRAAAIHGMLARTPAALLGVWLDDLTVETEPVNLPGIDNARHPNWSRRMRWTLETIRRHADVARALAGTEDRGTNRPTDATSPDGPAGV